LRDENQLISVAQKILSKSVGQVDLQTNLKDLTNDERIILTQYV
jgi:hypothetical protein